MAIIKKGDNVIDVVYKGVCKDSEPTQYGAYNIDVIKVTDKNGKVTQELHITDAVDKPVDRLQWRCDNLHSLAYFLNNQEINDMDISPMLGGLDLSNVTDMSSMFSGVVIQDIPFLDTSNVTNMTSMFQNAKKSTNILAETFDELPNVEKLNTRNANTMQRIFYNTNVKKLNLSGWNVDNVTNMREMFYECAKLTNLNLSNWNTSNVTTMNQMFRGCEVLSTIEGLSNFNTSEVTDMSTMFHDCKALTSLDLSNFNTSKVTTMASMFSYCDKLTTLDLSNFNTSKVTTMANMFQYSKKLETILGTIDMIKVTNAGTMFAYCNALTTVTLKNIKVALQLGATTYYGTLVTLDTLINTIKELWDFSSGTKTYNLTLSTASKDLLTNVYVKLITPTAEQIAADPNITSKMPCEVCQSTDEGAMLITDYATLKMWTIK